MYMGMSTGNVERSGRYHETEYFHSYILVIAHSLSVFMFLVRFSRAHPRCTDRILPLDFLPEDVLTLSKAPALSISQLE